MSALSPAPRRLWLPFSVPYPHISLCGLFNRHHSTIRYIFLLTWLSSAADQVAANEDKEPQAKGDRTLLGGEQNMTIKDVQFLES